MYVYVCMLREATLRASVEFQLKLSNLEICRLHVVLIPAFGRETRAFEHCFAARTSVVS